MAFLECKDVIKLYTGVDSEVQVAALRGIELSANKGDLIAIIGPSGSGKSTLIKMLGGLEYPSSGEIFVGEANLTKMTIHQLSDYRQRRVGFLYQFPERNLMWNMNVLKNVILPMKLVSQFGRREKKERALDLIKAVGLENRLDHKPTQLSGGEAQRVGIAVALANDPDIILADEPTGELDTKTTYKIIDYFKELNKSMGKTFIVVTHDERFANMTDKAMRIMDGRIISHHRAVDADAIHIREEFIFVDEKGNMRIPEDIRSELGIKEYVTIEIRDGIGCIIPAKRD